MKLCTLRQPDLQVIIKVVTSAAASGDSPLWHCDRVLVAGHDTPVAMESSSLEDSDGRLESAHESLAATGLLYPVIFTVAV